MDDKIKIAQKILDKSPEYLAKLNSIPKRKLAGIPDEKLAAIAEELVYMHDIDQFMHTTEATDSKHWHTYTKVSQACLEEVVTAGVLEWKYDETVLAGVQKVFHAMPEEIGLLYVSLLLKSPQDVAQRMMAEDAALLLRTEDTASQHKIRFLNMSIVPLSINMELGLIAEKLGLKGSCCTTADLHKKIKTKFSGAGLICLVRRNANLEVDVWSLINSNVTNKLLGKYSASRGLNENILCRFANVRKIDPGPKDGYRTYDHEIFGEVGTPMFVIESLSPSMWRFMGIDSYSQPLPAEDATKLAQYLLTKNPCASCVGYHHMHEQIAMQNMFFSHDNSQEIKSIIDASTDVDMSAIKMEIQTQAYKMVQAINIQSQYKFAASIYALDFVGMIETILIKMFDSQLVDSQQVDSQLVDIAELKVSYMAEARNTARSIGKALVTDLSAFSIADESNIVAHLEKIISTTLDKKIKQEGSVMQIITLKALLFSKNT